MTLNKLAPLLLLLTLVLFLLICTPSGLYFLCDDFAHVPEAAKGNFFQTHLLRPVLYVSLWLDNKWWGFNAEGFHVTNIVLHVLNALCVFFLSKAMCKKLELHPLQGNLVPLLIATFFLSYAFHSEPLFWIVGRDALLCALFLQAALLFYLKENVLYRFFSLLCFVAALFTYELSWAFPLFLTALFFYERYTLMKTRTFQGVGLYWLVFLFYLWYRFQLLHSQLSYGADNALAGRIIALLRNLATLTARLFIPPMQSGLLFLTSFLFGCAVLVFVLAKVQKKAKQQFYALIVIGVFTVVALLPAISLGIDTHDTESERFIYMATVFFAMFFVFTAALLLRKRAFFILMTVTIALNTYGLYVSSKAYRYASSVSRLTLEAVNKHTGVNSLRFINLPTQYKGALLFRIGFMNNSAGILTKTYDSVNVVSYREVTQPVRFSVCDSVANSATQTMTIEFRDSSLVLY